MPPTRRHRKRILRKAHSTGGGRSKLKVDELGSGGGGCLGIGGACTSRCTVLIGTDSYQQRRAVTVGESLRTDFVLYA